MTAALPMGTNKITGMADPTVSTDGATKNYVDNSVAAFFSTGDLKTTYKTVADSGWVMGGGNSTIGNAGSGAVYANVNALALYTLIWNNISSPTANAFCAVVGGIGASAAADWAGLKPLSTGFFNAHALGIAGGGGTLTTRVLGANNGAETSTIAQVNLPNVNFTVTATGNAAIPVANLTNVSGATDVTHLSLMNNANSTAGTMNASTVSVTGTAASGGSGTALPIVMPTIWVNVMIKL